MTAKRLPSLILTAFLLLLAACGGSGAGSSLPVTLQSIKVTASSNSVPAGLSLQFKAVAAYSDGSSQDLTSSAAWSSSNTGVATVAGGLATAKAQGSVTITATSGQVSGGANLSVTAPTVTSITVTPATATIAVYTSEQFRANGTFSDGSSQDVTSSVIWSSSQVSIATISSTAPTAGLSQALSAGQSMIVASSGSISGSASLTVTGATLTSITVTPASSTIPLGTIEQLTATGTFSDGSTQDVTNSATWYSSASSIASVTTGSGLVTAKRTGTASITATLASVQGNASLTVNLANLVSIAPLPANPSIANGTTQSFVAIGTFNDGATRNLAYSVTWSSSNTGVATVASSGVALCHSVGTTTITASAAGVSGSATLTATNATLSSISVAPAGANIAPATTIPFSATGTFSDGTTQNLSVQTVWNSDTPLVATVDSIGNVKGLSAGTAHISAGLLGVTGSVPVTVTSASPVSIAVTPSGSFIPPGGVLQFRAVATFSDGSTQDITHSAAWASSDTTVAVIAIDGVATGQKAGSASITATLSSVSGSTGLLVSSAALVSIAINPFGESLAEQTSGKLNAIGNFADGTQQDISTSVSWTSSNPGVATIGKQTGVITGISPGATTVTAVFSGVVGSTGVTVTNAQLVSVSISPSSPVIALGSSTKFHAVGTFSDRTTQDLTNFIAWRSANPGVAVIDNNGTATAAGVGTTSITATLNGVTGAASLTVQ